MILLASLPVALLPLVVLGWVPFHFGALSYDDKRLLGLGGLSLVLLGLALPTPLRTRAHSLLLLLPLPARLGLLAMGGLGLLSALTSAWPRYGLLGWALWLALAGGVLYTAAWRHWLGQRADLLLLTAVMALVALVALVALYVGDFYAAYLWATFAREVAIIWDTPFLHFANIRFLSQVQSWTLPLLPLAVAWAWPRSRSLGVLLALLGAAWWALHMASGTRGTWLALLLTALLLPLLLRRRCLGWLGWSAGLLLAGGLVYAALFWGTPGTPGLERPVSRSGEADAARLALWHHAWNTAAEQPWLGAGPLHYANGYAPAGRGHPHNVTLRFLAEWGWPATLLLAGLALWLLAIWVRRERPCHWGRDDTDRHDDLVVSSVLAAVLAGHCHALVSGIWMTPASQYLGMAVLGWATGLALRHGALETARPPWTPSRQLLALGGAAAILAALWVPIAGHPGQLRAIERDQASQGHRLNPRFWLQGRLDRPPWRAAATPNDPRP